MPAFERQQSRSPDINLAHPVRVDRAVSHAVSQENSLLAQQQSLGNQMMQRMLNSPAVQDKLAINKPSDQYEQEAERAAELITQASERSSLPTDTDVKAVRANNIQRVQAEDFRTYLPARLEARGQIPRGSGRSLPEDIRNFFESRFGYDFRQVRIHTDADATAWTESLGARSITSGQHIMFGVGQYQPATVTGRKLLAHELTHVVQQREIHSAPSAVGMLQMQPRSVTLEPLDVTPSEVRRRRALEEAGWRQTSIIATFTDYDGTPLTKYGVAAEFKAPGVQPTIVGGEISGGALILSNVWLQPVGTIRFLAFGIEGRFGSIEGAKIYQLPDRGPLMFEVVRKSTERTVTATTGEEAAAKVGAKGTFGVDYKVLKAGGEVSSELATTTRTSRTETWKVILPTREFVINPVRDGT